MIKKLVISTVLFSASVFTMAQSQTVTHTMQRGETIESIAKQYHVSVEDINKANPNMDGLVYVGMKLVVPINKGSDHSNDAKIAKEQEKETLPLSASDSQPALKVDNSFQEPEAISNNKKNMSDFNFLGVDYRAAFESTGEGFYAIGFNTFSPSGFGAEFFMGADYGLIDSDYAGLCFYAGPVYGYSFHNVLLKASLDFVGYYMGTGDRMRTRTNAKGETSTYKGNELEFSWGISFSPCIGIKVRKVTPYVGLDFLWSEAAKRINVGFIAGLGFHI